MERDGMDDRRHSSSVRNAQAALLGNAARAAGGHVALARTLSERAAEDARLKSLPTMLFVSMPLPASSWAPRHDAVGALADLAHAKGIGRDLEKVRLAAATIVDDHVSLWLDVGRAWTGGPSSEAATRLAKALGGSLRNPCDPDERDAETLDDLMRSRLDQLRRIDRATPIRWRKALRIGVTAHGSLALASVGTSLVGHVPWREISPLLGLAIPVDLVALPLAVGAVSRIVCARRRRANVAPRTVPGHEEAGLRRPAPRTVPPTDRDPVPDHWSTLRRLAPEAGGRIDEARRTCADLLALAADHAAGDGVEAVVMVESHLPKLVREGAALADAARPAERAAVVERLLRLVDGVAAEAERARDGLLQQERDRFAATSAFVEARVTPSPLSSA